VARRGTVLAALVALGAGLTAPAAAGASPPVRLTAAFEEGATLGAPSALRVGLRLDSRRKPTPVRELRLLYPQSLGVVSSGLGLAACEPSASDLAQIIVDGSGLDGCPRNSVMGYGTAVAEVRLSSGQVIPEYATLTMLSGPFQLGGLGIVIYVDGQRPFGGRLLFGGRIGSAPAPYGGAIGFSLPEIPSLEGVAVVALVDLQITIGARRITYQRRTRGGMVAYRPEGIVLPNRCPRGGFRFRAHVGFQDGSRLTTATVLPCPPRRAAARGR
jgi:hypothetical protein